MRAWFPEEAEATQWQRCQRLLETASTRAVVRVKGMQEAVSQLAAAGEQEFEQLNDFLDHEQMDEFIRSRFGAKAKAPAVHFTPKALKDLRPPMDCCVISLQVAKHQFAGYYPRLLTKEQLERKRKPKKNFTTARGFAEVRTRFQALKEVVHFLWSCHKKRGFVGASIVFPPLVK